MCPNTFVHVQIHSTHFHIKSNILGLGTIDKMLYYEIKRYFFIINKVSKLLLIKLITATLCQINILP